MLSLSGALVATLGHMVSKDVKNRLMLRTCLKLFKAYKRLYLSAVIGIS